MYIGGRRAGRTKCPMGEETKMTYSDLCTKVVGEAGQYGTHGRGLIYHFISSMTMLEASTWLKDNWDTMDVQTFNVFHQAYIVAFTTGKVTCEVFDAYVMPYPA
jgi:hypothetical protein